MKSSNEYVHMNLDAVKKILLDVISKHPGTYVNVLKSRTDWEEMKSVIFCCTQKLDSFNVKLKTRIYWVLNDLEDAPLCMNEECKRSLIEKDVKNLTYGYPHHCCPQCAKDSSVRKSKYENTCEKKYGKGVKNALASLEVRAKVKQKMIAEHGVDNPAKSEEAKSNARKTCLKRYGCECTFQSDEVKHKSQQTNLKKYGVKSFSQTDQYAAKVKATNNKNFGVDYPMQDPEFRKAAQKRYEYKEMQFDSKLELAVYVYCEMNNIKCVLHPKVDIAYVHDNRTHAYQPDFIIDGKLVEVKGLHFFEDKDPSKRMVNPYDHSQDALYEAKHQCMLTNDVKILTDLDCKKHVQFVIQHCGKDFFDACKHK